MCGKCGGGEMGGEREEYWWERMWDGREWFLYVRLSERGSIEGLETKQES
jgi:hypothetical protein